MPWRNVCAWVCGREISRFMLCPRFVAYDSGRYEFHRNRMDAIWLLPNEYGISNFSSRASCRAISQWRALYSTSSTWRSSYGIVWDHAVSSIADWCPWFRLQSQHSVVACLRQTKRSIRRRWHWVSVCLAHSPDNKVNFAGPDSDAQHRCSHSLQMHSVAASLSPDSYGFENVKLHRIDRTCVVSLLRWHCARCCRQTLEGYCRCAIDDLRMQNDEWMRWRNQLKKIW